MVCSMGGTLPGSGVKLSPSLLSGPEQDLPCCLLCFRLKIPPSFSLKPPSPLPPVLVTPLAAGKIPLWGGQGPAKGADAATPPAAGWSV